MKYLKKFNENKNNILLDIKNMLAYLLDDGSVTIKLFKLENNRNYDVIFIKINNKSWNDIKDDIIPLVKYLNDNYYFGRIDGGIRQTIGVPDFKVDANVYSRFDVIKDRLDIDGTIAFIKFLIVKK